MLLRVSRLAAARFFVACRASFDRADTVTWLATDGAAKLAPNDVATVRWRSELGGHYVLTQHGPSGTARVVARGTAQAKATLETAISGASLEAGANTLQ